MYCFIKIEATPSIIYETSSVNTGNANCARDVIRTKDS